jgi:peptidoglycan hydrolase-like protein with peptidoglycan-binding domain
MYEAWTPAEIPTDVITFMQTLPSPNNFHYQWPIDLKIGQFGEDIKFLQVALMILGFLKPINPDDLGHYGPRTSVAVMAYQQSKGIYPTAPNNVGPKTRAALNKQFV